MKLENSGLIAYKKIELESEGRLKFFLEKHSTKEGTWAKLEFKKGKLTLSFSM